MDLEKLATVFMELNKVEVHGKENMSRLLYCIQQLEEFYAKAKEAEKRALNEGATHHEQYDV